MRRKHNTYWIVSSFDGFNYHGRKDGWLPTGSKIRRRAISHHYCYTKSRALRSAAKLKAAGANDITLSQVTYKHGQRLFLDYSYN